MAHRAPIARRRLAVVWGEMPAFVTPTPLAISLIGVARCGLVLLRDRLVVVTDARLQRAAKSDLPG